MQVEAFAPPGLTLTAKVFAVDSDIDIADADAVAEQANAKGAYLAQFNSLAAGTYLIVLYDAGVAVACAYFVADGAAFARSGNYADVVSAAHAELMRKIAINKMVTDPATGLMTVFEDDGVTPALTAQLYEDAAATQPYRGRGAEVRERLE